MEEIRIKKIKTKNNRLDIEFFVSCNLKKYFKEYNFEVEYEERIEDVPCDILVIPFICNVLPIVWLTDAKLYVDELDKEFFDCLNSIKAGYKRMYPRLNFSGQVQVANLAVHDESNDNKKACFFSGGVDALFTVINHIGCRPDLITIHGSADFPLSETIGWEVQKHRIQTVAKKLCLKTNFITSNFYEFIDVWGELNTLVLKSNDAYWHGFQHGIGLIGLAAPLAFIKGYRILYIASSYTVDDDNTCASDPIIDNQVRFIGSTIVHDGYNYNRQEKVRAISKYVRNNKLDIPIQVCLYEREGHNCGCCEKCIRTAVAFWAEGVSPSVFEIPDSYELQLKNIEFMNYQYRWSQTSVVFYRYIQARFIENAANIPDCPYKKWMEVFDPYSVFSLKSKLKRFVYHFKKKI